MVLARSRDPTKSMCRTFMPGTVYRSIYTTIHTTSLVISYGDINGEYRFIGNTRGTLLDCAVTKGRLDLVLLLLGSGADKDSSGGYPVRYAVSRRMYDILKLLLESGADPNLLKEGVYTATTLALRNIDSALVYNKDVAKEDVKILKLLLKNNAGPPQWAYITDPSKRMYERTLAEVQTEVQTKINNK